MQLKNDESRYGVVAQLFHWTIVVLIIVQFILANRAHDLPLGSAKIALAQPRAGGAARHTAMAKNRRARVAHRLVCVAADHTRRWLAHVLGA